jgi:hypothetical protein
VLLTKFPGEANRVRCFLHILNLVAKEILKPFDTIKSKRKTVASALAQQDESDFEEEYTDDEFDDGETMEPEFGEQKVPDEATRPMLLKKVNFVIYHTHAISRHLTLFDPSYAKYHTLSKTQQPLSFQNGTVFLNG